jgi:hypothetical protein
MRGRFAVDRHGIKRRRPLARAIPWTAIAEISPRDGVHVIHIVGPEPRQYPTGLGIGEWDAWQLPHLAEALRAG